MSHHNVSRFALLGCVVGFAAGLLLIPLTGAISAPVWAFAGWAVAVLGGLAGGVVVLRRFGPAGAGFVGALGGSLAGRLGFYTAAGLLAASRGRDALFAYPAGLAIGYVAIQVFEMVWFYRLSRAV